MGRVIALGDIDDPDLLRKHVRLAILEREYFKQRAKELREELDKLKGLTPARVASDCPPAANSPSLRSTSTRTPAAGPLGVAGPLKGSGGGCSGDGFLRKPYFSARKSSHLAALMPAATPRTIAHRPRGALRVEREATADLAGQLA